MKSRADKSHTFRSVHVPTYSDTVTDLPGISVWSGRIDDPGDLVTRSTRIDDSRQGTFLGQSVAVADATCLNLDSGATGAWLRNWLVFRRETSTRAAHDYSFHHKLLR
jgi:hypothetical protein